MKNINPVYLIFQLCILGSLNPVYSQIDKGNLVLEKVITSKLAEDEEHSYTIFLHEKEFAVLKLNQLGIDVAISVFDPVGKAIGEFDSPNGVYGPEYITIYSTIDGSYSFLVKPWEEELGTGQYSFVLEKVEPIGETQETRMDQIFTLWNHSDTPGAAVAVVKDGKIVFSKGYGIANLEYDIPITSSTIFHIASVSKQFTTFSVMLLEEEGKLSLEDDIRKYIPEVPDFGKVITLKHLANHTSGLRDQWNLLVMAGWRMDDVITKEHILKLVAKQKELNFEPGDEYAYCNTGFTLLAEVVARVSGKSFAEFTNERIFEPLKMSNTLFYDDHEKVVKNRAYSYQHAEGGYKKSVLNYANVGATSLFTTVDDLSLWAMNFAAPRVGSKEIFEQMRQEGELNNGKITGYGLGQAIGLHKGLRVISHGGGDAGYRTYLARFPDQDISVIVFSNDAAFSSSKVAYEVADFYLESQYEKEPEKEQTTANDAKDLYVSPEILAEYVGSYELQAGMVITITLDKNQLFGKLSGALNPLIAITEVRFRVSDVGAELSFHKDDQGKINLLKLHEEGRTVEAEKMPPFNKEAVVLEDYAGYFYSEELTTGYDFKPDSGQLLVVHSKVPDIKLDPSGADLFKSRNWVFRKVEFKRNSENEIIGCYVSNGRVSNLWFEKE